MVFFLVVFHVKTVYLVYYFITSLHCSFHLNTGKLHLAILISFSQQVVSESQVCQALMLRWRFPSATFKLSVWMAKLDDLEGKDGGPTLLQRSLRIYGRWFYEVRVLVGRKLEEVWLQGHRHHSTMGGWHRIPPCIEWDISKITLKEAWRYLWKKGRWQQDFLDLKACQS